ncbi:hypothetical protein ACOME3_006148 [Neoechinorhynchus agilis]
MQSSIAKSSIPINKWSLFRILLLVRLSCVPLNIIDDCDEVFNFYEPLHWMVYGHGMQTWEYAPQFALRSYAYLAPFAGYLCFLKPFISKPNLFFFFRSLLAFLHTTAEVHFIGGVQEQYGNEVSKVLAVVLATNTGMNRASTCFVNNSITMMLIMASYGSWFKGHLITSIVLMAASCILGWTYAAIIGLPIAIDIIFRRKNIHIFVLSSLLSGILITIPMVIVDSWFYGKWTLTPLNHVLYNLPWIKNILNMESGNEFTRSTLYGVESWTFYLKNAILNFNVLAPIALIPITLSLLIKLRIETKHRQHVPIWFIGFGIVIWSAVLLSSPHKEDRFMYPVYPLVCLLATFGLFYIKASISDRFSTAFILLICIVHAILSLSRMILLFKGYYAPIDTFTWLSRSKNETGIICLGPDWYRYPSHLLTPDK